MRERGRQEKERGKQRVDEREREGRRGELHPCLPVNQRAEDVETHE